MQVTDRFTTQDGEWIASSKRYSISQDRIDKYGAQSNELGGATHIFVNAPQGVAIHLETTGPTPVTMDKVSEAWDKWINFPMYHSSAYNPDRGELGPWNLYANGELLVSGIGLPFGWHVSTFLVIAEGNATPVPAPPPSSKDSYLVLEGITVWRN